MNAERKKELPLRRLIVKLGTTNLCNQSGQLDQTIFNDIARQVIKLQSQKIQVIIVSSGAIKAGEESMKSLDIKTTGLGKKELAGIGASDLMNRWKNAFAFYKKAVVQVWFTYGNWANEGERRTLLSTIFNCLNAKVTPIMNELDVVSNEEVKWMEKRISENDRLAKMVAFQVGADAVLFLTDEGGIYEENPQENLQARLYEEVSARAKPEVIGISDGVSKRGRGGMIAKWREASRCAKQGMQVAIAGREEDVVLKFVRGESVGTRIGTITKLKQE